jgi:integrase
MLCTGIRIGEALALKWTDVDWENKVLHIQRNYTLAEVKTPDGESRSVNKIVERTKSKSSTRFVGLNDLAIKSLIQLKGINGDFEFITGNKSGKPSSPYGISYSFHRALEAIGLPKRGIHNLRHTFATQLFAKGVDVKVISELLGHSSVAITYNAYIHVINDQKKAAVQAINFIDLDPED